MLLQDAMAGKFDIILILAEALDRLSRNQEDIAGIYKRLSFAGVKIVTLSKDEPNPHQQERPDRGRQGGTGADRPRTGDKSDGNLE